MKNKYIFECTNCGSKYLPEEVTYLCPNCEKGNTTDNPPRGVLRTIYNYERIKTLYKGDLFSILVKNQYLELLPVSMEHFGSPLNVGNTPLYKYSKLDNLDLDFDFYVKDDSQNPTFSFKDRASNLVSAYAKANSIKTIVTASTGNAGSSLAGICASQGQRAIVFVPASAPQAKLTQIVMYGATIIPVNGTYDDAFDLCVEATKKFGWYNRNTAYNPFTIEGKKIVSFELFDQMQRTLPDRIFVPVGDGVIISGIYKGFEDLFSLGLIDKIPTIVAVQAEGSSNIVNNLGNKGFVFKQATTVADSIAVNLPRNFYMTRMLLKKYLGETVKVSDNEILSASKKLSSSTGLFAEPAAASAFAGMLKYFAENRINSNSKNVIILTGSGLKDLKSLSDVAAIPEPIEPNLNDLKRFLKK